MTLHFIPSTSVKEIDSLVGSTYAFNFASFEDLMMNKFADNQMVDIIGVVVHVGNIISGEFNKKANKRRVIRLQDLSGLSIDCTLWDIYVDEFGDYIQKLKLDGHVVLIMQFGKLKTYRGSTSVGTALFGTRLFINTEMQEIMDFKRMFLANPRNQIAKLRVSSVSIESTPVDPTGFFSDCKTVTLCELSSIYKETMCATVATIDSVCKDKPWFYIACLKCACGVTATDTNDGEIGNVNNKWTCKQCGPNVTSVAPRAYTVSKLTNDEAVIDAFVKQQNNGKVAETSSDESEINSGGRMKRNSIDVDSERDGKCRLEHPKCRALQVKKEKL